MQVECIVAGLTVEERKQNAEHQKQWLIKQGAEIIKTEIDDKQIVITYKI